MALPGTSPRTSTDVRCIRDGDAVPAGGGRRASRAAGRPSTSVAHRPGRAAAHHHRRGARAQRRRPRRALRVRRLPAGAARRREARARRCAAPTSTARWRGLWPAYAAHRGRVRRGAGAARRAAAPHPRRRAPPPTRSTRGTSSWPRPAPWSRGPAAASASGRSRCSASGWAARRPRRRRALQLPHGLAATGRRAARAALAERRAARPGARLTTSAGPHLDDVELREQGRELRAFGSQGEQRTAVLALLLAEAALLRETRGEPPVLLLDDVLSELDAGRRARAAGAAGGARPGDRDGHGRRGRARRRPACCASSAGRLLPTADGAAPVRSSGVDAIGDAARGRAAGRSPGRRARAGAAGVGRRRGAGDRAPRAARPAAPRTATLVVHCRDAGWAQALTHDGATTASRELARGARPATRPRALRFQVGTVRPPRRRRGAGARRPPPGRTRGPRPRWPRRSRTSALRAAARTA